jgi:hypothetical protein
MDHTSHSQWNFDFFFCTLSRDATGIIVKELWTGTWICNLLIFYLYFGVCFHLRVVVQHLRNAFRTLETTPQIIHDTWRPTWKGWIAAKDAMDRPIEDDIIPFGCDMTQTAQIISLDVNTTWPKRQNVSPTIRHRLEIRMEITANACLTEPQTLLTMIIVRNASRRMSYDDRFFFPTRGIGQ